MYKQRNAGSSLELIGDGGDNNGFYVICAILIAACVFLWFQKRRSRAAATTHRMQEVAPEPHRITGAESELRARMQEVFFAVMS